MKEHRSPFNLTEFLKRYGIFIYTGDPEGDLLLIEEDIRELRQLGVIDNEEYLEAIAALRSRAKKA